MLDLEHVTVLIRGINLLLWLGVVKRIIEDDRPLSRLARRMVGLVIVFGMAVFVVGSLVPFGFPGQWASLIYTAFTAFAAILAVALLSTGEPNGVQDEDDL